MKCRDCQWWDKSRDRKSMGTCRFSPPLAGNSFGLWPETTEDDFCGKWSERVTEDSNA